LVIKELKNRCRKDKVKRCQKGFVYRRKRCVKVKCGKGRCPKVVCAKGFFSRKYKHTCCKRCVPCKCSKYFDPVCATNGVTFRNACDAKCSGFKIKHKGACTRKCDGSCPNYISPVCGKDNRTYRNRCVLNQQLIGFKYAGECRKHRFIKDPLDKKRKHHKKINKAAKKNQKIN